jgi:hypothetical protein
MTDGTIYNANVLNISDIIPNTFGTESDSSRDDSIQTVDTIIYKKHDKKHDKKSDAMIYRYKFTQEFMDHLYQFSKIHQYDDRKVFKDSWDIFKEDSDDIISSEMRRLEGLNYNGDILDKMFKSARYYFRKKTTLKKEPVQRRVYINVQKELLSLMDTHILEKLHDKPSTGFINFCENHATEIKQNITKLIENNLEPQEIINKIKKTYKNRYFILTNK